MPWDFHKVGKTNLYGNSRQVFGYSLSEYPLPLQEASNYQAQDNLPEVLAVFFHISKEKSKSSLLFDILFALHLISAETRPQSDFGSNAFFV